MGGAGAGAAGASNGGGAGADGGTDAGTNQATEFNELIKPRLIKPTKSRKKTKSLYICILKLLSSTACLYMCDPSILIVHLPHQISQPLATGQIIFIVDFPHRESRYSQRFSLVQKSVAAAMVFCPFSTFLHLLTREPNQPAITLYPFEREVDLFFY